MKFLKGLIPAGRSSRTVRSGLLAGIRLYLDLQRDMQVYLGLYERETLREIRRLMVGCVGAIDLGAGQGDLVAYLLTLPRMRSVVAVEPGEAERSLLLANAALNGFSADSRLRLHPGFAGWGPKPLWKTLDELAVDVPSPVFIKIDIEGAEAQVLAGGREVLRNSDARLLVETHSLEAERDCTKQLKQYGYNVKIIDSAWWRVVLPEYRPLPHNRWLSAWRAIQSS